MCVIVYSNFITTLKVGIEVTTSRTKYTIYATNLIKKKRDHTHLLHLGQMQGILVLGSELHEPHVATLTQLRDGSDPGEELEHCLDGHDCVAVGQGVLLCRVGQLLVDDHHIFRQQDAGP